MVSATVARQRPTERPTGQREPGERCSQPPRSVQPDRARATAVRTRLGFEQFKNGWVQLEKLVE